MSLKRMRFCLFGKRFFEVENPVTLIEAYCFQSDFYKNYDLLMRKGKRSIKDVGKIGARIEERALSRCKSVVERHKHLAVFELDLDSFLKLDEKVREDHVIGLCEVINELDDVKGIGLSKATKILHTLFPKIIPIIDKALQKEYRKIKGTEELKQLFMDYYDNFLEGNTYMNLCEIHMHLRRLDLTKIRIFDILWWSYLKAQQIERDYGVNWQTIQTLEQ